MFKVNWNDASIVYSSCLCFPDEIIEKLAERFTKLNLGTRILTLKRLPFKSEYILKHLIKIRMSWGLSNLYIYTRV